MPLQILVVVTFQKPVLDTLVIRNKRVLQLSVETLEDSPGDAIRALKPFANCQNSSSKVVKNGLRVVLKQQNVD